MLRYALTDRQWQLVEDLLPKERWTRNQWKDHRTVVNGTLWILRTGAPWRDLPKEFGSGNAYFPWETIRSFRVKW